MSAAVPVTYYLFRPASLVAEVLLRDWTMICNHMRRTPGRKIVALWCDPPPGSWDLRDVEFVSWTSGIGIA